MVMKSTELNDAVKELLPSDLLAKSGELSEQYSRNRPFPHLVIDNFFKREAATSLAGSIEAIPDRDYGVTFRSLAQRKMQLGKIVEKAPHIYDAYETLMGSTFTRLVEIVSGYPRLEADHYFAGAGLHRYDGRGFSEIHLD